MRNTATDLYNFAVADFYRYKRLFRFFYTADKYNQAFFRCHSLNIGADTVVQSLSFCDEVIGLLGADNLQFL